MRGVVLLAALPVVAAAWMACAAHEPEPAADPTPIRIEISGDDGARERASPDPALDERTYAQIADGISAEVEAEILVWATTHFSTQADALAALEPLLPTSSTTGERLKRTLDDFGVRPKAVRQFVLEHRDAAERIGAARTERLTEVMARPEVRDALDRVLALPTGNRPAATVGRPVTGSPPP